MLPSRASVFLWKRYTITRTSETYQEWVNEPYYMHTAPARSISLEGDDPPRLYFKPPNPTSWRYRATPEGRDRFLRAYKLRRNLPSSSDHVNESTTKYPCFSWICCCMDAQKSKAKRNREKQPSAEEGKKFLDPGNGNKKPAAAYSTGNSRGPSNPNESTILAVNTSTKNETGFSDDKQNIAAPENVGASRSTSVHAIYPQRVETLGGSLMQRDSAWYTDSQSNPSVRHHGNVEPSIIRYPEFSLNSDEERSSSHWGSHSSGSDSVLARPLYSVPDELLHLAEAENSETQGGAKTYKRTKGKEKQQVGTDTMEATRSPIVQEAEFLNSPESANQSASDPSQASRPPCAADKHRWVQSGSSQTVSETLCFVRHDRCPFCNHRSMVPKHRCTSRATCTLTLRQRILYNQEQNSHITDFLGWLSPPNLEQHPSHHLHAVATKCGSPSLPTTRREQSVYSAATSVDEIEQQNPDQRRNATKRQSEVCPDSPSLSGTVRHSNTSKLERSHRRRKTGEPTTGEAV